MTTNSISMLQEYSYFIIMSKYQLFQMQQKHQCDQGIPK